MQNTKPFKTFLLYIYSCCNSCESVLEAYRLKKWNVQLDKIEQCKDQYKRSDADAFKEGCRIQGHLEVNRVSMYIIALEEEMYTLKLILVWSLHQTIA